MSAADLKAQLRKLEEEKTRLIYAHRIEQAKEHLVTLDPASEEYAQTAKHLADLEATGYHLKKEE